MQIGTSCPIHEQVLFILQQNMPNQNTFTQLKVLRTIYENLIKPDPKYRELDLGKKGIQNALALVGAKTLLEMTGFNKQGSVYILWDCPMRNKIIYILTQEIESFIVHGEQDAETLKRIADNEAKKEYKQKLIDDFELNKREVYAQKMKK